MEEKIFTHDARRRIAQTFHDLKHARERSITPQDAYISGVMNALCLLGYDVADIGAEILGIDRAYELMFSPSR